MGKSGGQSVKQHSKHWTEPFISSTGGSVCVRVGGRRCTLDHRATRFKKTTNPPHSQILQSRQPFILRRYYSSLRRPNSTAERTQAPNRLRSDKCGAVNMELRSEPPPQPQPHPPVHPQSQKNSSIKYKFFNTRRQSLCFSDLRL